MIVLKELWKPIALLVVFAVSTTLAVEARYAHVETVQKIEYRLDEKIKNDQCNVLQQQLWRLKDRYGPTCGIAKDTCRMLLEDRRRLGCR